MTDQTPATEAGRRLVDSYGYIGASSIAKAVRAIEAEARADGMMQGMGASYQEGRADARKEAAERVRALPRSTYGRVDVGDVLAILDPEPKP